MSSSDHVTTPRTGRPRIVWKFRASVPPVPPQKVDWWEGNVAVGPGGNLYAGNTGGTAYAVRSDGSQLWTFTAGNSLWTTPAFAPDGSSFWGSVDLHIYHLSATGQALWRTFVPGYVVSSPAIGSDGTVYVGAFDSKLYALAPTTGAVRWSFKTSDHIYASPALGEDASGHTDAIYIASANGSVYALTPQGRLLWSYDTGAPVRSSPALGAAPGADHSGIVYVGSSNGRLYAINANTGRLRWSYNTTPSNPVLRVRNNLNASPALGKTGVYIAGQDGYVYYVPYDYCLHRRNPRCSTGATPGLTTRNERRGVPRRRWRQHHPKLDRPRGFFGHCIQPTPGRPSARTQDRERRDPQPRSGGERAAEGWLHRTGVRRRSLPLRVAQGVPPPGHEVPPADRG